MYQHPIPVACAILINDRDEILLGLRADCEKWSDPGGKLSADETIVQAAVRELREETNLVADPEQGEIIGFAEEFGTSLATYQQRFITFFVAFKQWSGEAKVMEPTKCLLWHWTPLDELPSLDRCTAGTSTCITKFLLAYAERLRQERANIECESLMQLWGGEDIGA